MQSIEINGLAELDAKLQAILKELPEARRQLHERLAEMAKKEVDAQIDASGLNDSHGKIKGWQESYVGSGGGYAAVRPQRGQTGANSPGAITNYLESGHRIRQPSGKSKYYRPRIKKPYVDGYHFYQAAQIAVESKAIAEAERFIDELADKLEG